jgi:hypothetical protein
MGSLVDPLLIFCAFLWDGVEGAYMAVQKVLTYSCFDKGAADDDAN